MDERDLADRLDRFLDRLATGEAHRGAVDPELAAIARRYHVLGHSSAPAGARQRVRRRIRSRPAGSARGNEDRDDQGHGVDAAQPVAGRNGRIDIDVPSASFLQPGTPWSLPPVPDALAKTSSPVIARRLRGAAAQVATAVFVVLTLTAGSLAVWHGQHQGPDEPTWLPAIIGGSLPAGFSEETVFTATFAEDELPEANRTALLYAVTLAPGASLPYLVAPTCDFHCGDRALDYRVSAGVGAEVVQSGLYSVRLAAPLAVQRRGSAGPPVEFPAQREVILGPGDAAIYHDHAAPAALRNMGPEPVELFGVAIVDAVNAEDRLPLPPGVAQGMLTNTIPADWETLPPGPLQMTVRRVMLPAGTSLPPYEPIGLEAIRVESGAIAWSYLRPGQDASGTARISQSTSATTPFTAAPPGARRVLHSVGDDPVVMLVVTIEPAAYQSPTLAPMPNAS